MVIKYIVFFISLLTSIGLFAQSSQEEREAVNQFVRDEKEHLRNLERLRREQRSGAQNTQTQTRTQNTTPAAGAARQTNVRNTETVSNTGQTAQAQSTFVNPEIKIGANDNFQFIGVQIAAGGAKNGDYSFMGFQIGGTWANFFPLKKPKFKMGIITQFFFEKLYLSNQRVSGFNYFTFDIMLGLKVKSFFAGIGISNRVSWKEKSELKYGMKQFDVLFAVKLGFITDSKILISADFNLTPVMFTGTLNWFSGYLSFGVGF